MDDSINRPNEAHYPDQACEAFDRVWDELAEAGSCDARGGREYARCLLIWKLRREEPAIRSFIMEAANPVFSPAVSQERQQAQSEQ